mgnify:CR=1 FL=1
MKSRQFEIWIADLNPRFGTETGKTRPVVVVQTDYLNKVHPSTVICPITTNLRPDIELLRVRIEEGQIDKPSDILIDQIRAIDNRRVIKIIGKLNKEQILKIKKNIKILLDL